MQSRHRHCSVFGHHMYVRLRPHTALINNIMCIKFNYYKRTRCSSRDNTTPVPHTFIERSSMQNRHCHCSVVYKDGITTSYCIEHQWHLQFLKLSHSNTNKHTFCSSRARQHDTHSIHSTNKDQRRPVINCHCTSCIREWDASSYTASITNNTTQFKRTQNTTHTNKRTYCSPRANTTPVVYMH